MAKRIVLFLDFDGVLHPKGFNNQAGPFSNAHILWEVLLDPEFDNRVEIVISSSWKDYHAIDDLKEMFPDGIKPLVTGVTPSAINPRETPRHEREWEIETWLTANRPDGAPWIAIDDRPDWFQKGSPHLLVTKGSFGFSFANQDTLRAMLRERLGQIQSEGDRTHSIGPVLR